MDNYDVLVERIAKAANIEKEEIERKIEAKKAKLSGLISKDGAAQIVAAELGINLDKEKVKINELGNSTKRANFVGKIISMFPVREFNKNGREGKVLAMTVGDDSSNVRVVLWDTNHIALFEQNKIKQDDIIEVANAYVRNGEIHLTGFSDIKLSDEKIENVKTERESVEKSIVELNVGDNASVRAFIVQSFEPRFFEVCPECSKKVTEGKCEAHGAVVGIKRALLNIVLDDGTETMRSVLFSESIDKLGVPEIVDKFIEKKDELIGKEMIFEGNVRKNKVFENNEMIINDAKDVDIDSLLVMLEK
ncbi:MAG: DUF2240 family protein [Nanoarchaeota archaeon]|nr:DUF2240 family protein [Nanoarchaeota archaeon]